MFAYQNYKTMTSLYMNTVLCHIYYMYRKLQIVDCVGGLAAMLILTLKF